MIGLIQQMEMRGVLALASLFSFVALVILYQFHPPDQMNAPIVAGFIGVIGGTCLGASFGYYFGTTKNRTDENVKQAAKALLVFLTVGTMLAFSPPAFAQTRAQKQKTSNAQLTGNIGADIKRKIETKTQEAGASLATALLKPFTDLAEYIGNDIDGAIALSTATDIKDGHGQQCALALKSFGRITKAHPVPATLKFATDIQAARLMVIAANQLCSNVHCTQVFGDMGALATAISPLPIPMPSLHSLCGKIPQIAVIPPVVVPPEPNDPAP